MKWDSATCWEEEPPGSSTVVAFCRRLLIDHGIATIPTSVFHSAEHAHHVHGLARFAFCKTDAVLQAATEKLGKLTA